MEGTQGFLAQMRHRLHDSIVQIANKRATSSVAAQDEKALLHFDLMLQIVCRELKCKHIAVHCMY